MNDLEFARHLADKAVTEDQHKLMAEAPALEGAPPGGLRGRLRAALEAIVAKFGESGQSVPWGKIIALIPQIIALVSGGGGSWASILSAIMAIFFPTPIPPAPNPNA